MCLKKCQGLSFNFNEINKTENCQLNDATAKLGPEALTRREGIKYYEITRTYFDKNVTIFVKSFLLINLFCDLSVHNIKVNILGNLECPTSVSNLASFCISLRIRK